MKDCSLIFNADEFQQIDVTAIVKQFNSNDLDPNEFIVSESRGILSRLSCEIFTVNWLLTPAAEVAIKTCMSAWNSLKEGDIPSSNDLKCFLLQWAAHTFWRTELYWSSESEMLDKYESPLEMMVGENFDKDGPLNIYGFYSKDGSFFGDFHIDG